MPEQNTQLNIVRAALARLDEDLELVNAVPVANTKAAQEQLDNVRRTAHERFVTTVREAV